MAHILLVDGSLTKRLDLRQVLEPRGHVAEDATGAAEAADEVAHQASIQTPIDLILIGDGLANGEGALDVVRSLGKDLCSHRAVLLGDMADLTPEALALGVMTVVAAHAAPADLAAGVEAAIARRNRYLGRQQEWALAKKALQGLTSDPSLAADAQLSVLATHQPQLEAALAAAGPTEPEVEAAFIGAETAANQALSAVAVSFEAALAPLAKYQFTATFERELRALFSTDRMRFWALSAELKRLGGDFMAHGRNFAGSHYAYPFGGDHVVYFRWSQGQRTLEGFGRAADEPATAERLKKTPEPATAFPGKTPVST